MLKRRPVLSLVAALFAGAASADAPRPATLIEPISDPPQAVQDTANVFTREGFAIKGYFKGPADLIGVAGAGADGPMIFFLDSDATTFIAGAVIDLTSGANLTALAGEVMLEPGSNDDPRTLSGLMSEMAQFKEGVSQIEPDDIQPAKTALELPAVDIVADASRRVICLIDIERSVHPAKFIDAMTGSPRHAGVAFALHARDNPESVTRAAYALGDETVGAAHRALTAETHQLVRGGTLARGAMKLEAVLQFLAGERTETPTRCFTATSHADFGDNGLEELQQWLGRS